MYSNIKIFKNAIATAITNNGVSTSSIDSTEKIVENIYKISTNAEQGKAYLLGTSSGTYNIKSLCENYRNLTNENFVIEYTANTYTVYASGGGSMSYTWSKDKLCSYNSETGELNVNNINTTEGNSSDRHYVSATIKNVYLVLMGEKYTGAENESKVFKIGNGASVYDIKLAYKGYGNLSEENFIFDYIANTYTVYASGGGSMNYTWNKENLYSYNKETGKLIINNLDTTVGNSNDTHKIKTTTENIYLITK